MTLLFVTAHDPATHANLKVAGRLLRTTDQALFGHMATRTALQDAISSTPESKSLFVMSHGSREAVLDNNSVAAVTATDYSLLSNYTIFAWACHTGATLGYELAQYGVTWWGYDCAITAPDDREPYLTVHSDIFRVITGQFDSGTNVPSVHAVLEDIKVACENACVALDSLGAGSHADAFSLYSCCNQLWQRLSVWLAGCDQPCRHPLAPPAYIEI